MNVLKYVSGCRHLTGISETVRRARVRECAAGSVNDAVFPPSEQRVATAGGDMHTYIHLIISICICEIYLHICVGCMYVGDGLVKLWEPRDGSYVKRLQGHTSEGDKICIHTYILYMQKHKNNFEICICTSVFSVRYSDSEQFLVSAGADSQILGTSCILMYVLPYVCIYVCMW
jgi:hypothetical protein